MGRYFIILNKNCYSHFCPRQLRPSGWLLTAGKDRLPNALSAMITNQYVASMGHVGMNQSERRSLYSLYADSQAKLEYHSILKHWMCQIFSGSFSKQMALDIEIFKTISRSRFCFQNFNIQFTVPFVKS